MPSVQTNLYACCALGSTGGAVAGSSRCSPARERGARGDQRRRTMRINKVYAHPIHSGAAFCFTILWETSQDRCERRGEVAARRREFARGPGWLMRICSHTEAGL